MTLTQRIRAHLEALSPDQQHRKADRLLVEALERLEHHEKRMRSTHTGDCTIFSALINGRPTDGICTCGYGYRQSNPDVGDWSEMYSKERKDTFKK